MVDTARPIRFLLVEDDDDHADLIRRSLRRDHVAHEVDRVSDGAEALAYLRQEGDQVDSPRPDIIILDLNLPRVAGHEVLAEVKADVGLRNIPTVVLTTSQAESDRAMAYEHHANSYLVKPLDFDRFHEMIQDLRQYWGVWNIGVG